MGLAGIIRTGVGATPRNNPIFQFPSIHKEKKQTLETERYVEEGERRLREESAEREAHRRKARIPIHLLLFVFYSFTLTTTAVAAN